MDAQAAGADMARLEGQFDDRVQRPPIFRSAKDRPMTTLSTAPRAWILALMLLLPAAPGTAQAQGTAQYRNPQYGWSIQYPAGWRVDDGDPGFVRIMSEELQALCGVSSHRSAHALSEPDAFADYMMSAVGRDLERRGLAQHVLQWVPITLPEGVRAIDITVDIVPGGKSRRIFATAQTRLLIVDCETYAENWPRVEALYDRIMRSLTIEP
jgi:hypothetical protein